jgi:hypothetical protein
MNQEGQGPPLDSYPCSARQGRKWQPLRDLQTFSISVSCSDSPQNGDFPS